MADPNFVQQLSSTLATITSGTNTAAIKSATVQLNKTFYKQNQCVPALFEIAVSSSNVATQQLALVELRKRVQAKKSKQWIAQPVDIRQGIKSRLLEITINSTGPIRTGSARLVATIARLELPHEQWPELLPFIWECSASPLAARREVAVQSLYMLLDTLIIGGGVVGDDSAEIVPQGGPNDGHALASQTIDKYFKELVGIFAKTIQDPESLAVRVWTVRALGKLSEYVEAGEDESIRAFQELIPHMVHVVHSSLEAGDENSTKSCYEVFETLTISDAGLINTHLQDLIKFNLEAGSNKAYDDDMRVMALNGLLWLVKFKKAKVQQLGLAGSIISALLPIGAEPEPVETDEDAPARAAFRVLDALATSLPPAHVFPPLFQQVQQLAASPDPGMRKSAITAFGVVVEGCSMFIQPHLEQMWPLIVGGLGDPEMVVKKAACSALTYLCDMLGEECAKQHVVLLPLIFGLLGQEETQRAACVALDCFLENLGKDIEPYIPQLMEGLIQLLDSALIALKTTIVGAIGSAAHASKAKFAPYFEGSMQRIVPFLSLSQPGEELDLRGVAQDTLGTLAEAVGKEVFRPYFDPLMKAAIEATTVEDAPQLKECSYIFFAVISRVYGDEIQPYLSTIMPLLLAATQQAEVDEEALLEEYGGDATGFDAADGAVDAADADGDDGFEDIDDASISSEMFGASTAIAIEKEVAIDSIAELFSNAKTPFLPYLETSVKAVLPGLDHPWHDGIRKGSASTLLSFLASFHAMLGVPKWAPTGSPAPLPENFIQLSGAIVPAIMELWEEETEREVVHQIVASLSDTLQQVGSGLIVPTHIEAVCKNTLQILERKARCQLEDDEEDDAPANAEQSEYDTALIGAALDLVGTLALVLGADFAQVFPSFEAAMIAYYDPSRLVGDRSTSIGSLAEVVNGLGAAVTPYTDKLYQLFTQALADSEAEVRSNAAFAIGSLLYNTGADLSGQYLTVLGSLQPLFGDATGGAAENGKDNACGAVSRMILKNSAALPLDQVLPVYLSALPLRRDFAESAKVHEALCKLLSEQNPIALQQIDHILAVFKRALASLSDGFYPESDNGELTEDTKNGVVGLLKGVAASMPDKIQQAGLAEYLA